MMMGDGTGMENLTEQTCAAFTAALASKASVPGGGGAAALAGALGTALCSMAGNFTLGKKKYATVEADIQTLLEKGEKLRQRLLALVEEDARAFAPLSRAYGIPKDDPTRAAVLEAATLDACRAPMEIAAACCEAIVLLEEMRKKGSTLLLSDVGCGALLCRAALESAAMNVYVNTAALSDRAKARSLDAQLDAMTEQYVPRAEQLAQSVRRQIRKEGA